MEKITHITSGYNHNNVYLVVFIVLLRDNNKHLGSENVKFEETLYDIAKYAFVNYPDNVIGLNVARYMVNDSESLFIINDRYKQWVKGDKLENADEVKVFYDSFKYILKDHRTNI